MRLEGGMGSLWRHPLEREKPLSRWTPQNFENVNKYKRTAKIQQLFRIFSIVKLLSFK